MSNLSDDDINELIGDGTCTHLPQVRMAIEIQRSREMEKRLEAWAALMELRTPGSIVVRATPAEVAAELRNRMRGG